ncbi:hypothetical protein MMC17_000670 [Xylographa soralifera]|nr:hypothetical protein [Xylographa soralifera]
MDDIHQEAYATIIATSGGSAKIGLPGVSRPRKPQAAAVIGQRTVKSTILPHVSHYLRQAKWISRGWPFRKASSPLDAYSSPSFRSTSFVGQRCIMKSIRKSLDKTTERSQDDATLMNTDIFTGEKKFLGSLHLEKFSNHLEQYMSRNLTYEGDAINAFQGILARTSFRSFWGVLITDDAIEGHRAHKADAALARGLSLLEAIVYRLEIKLDGGRFDTKFCVLHPNGARATLEQLQTSAQSNCILEPYRLRYVEARIFLVALRRDMDLNQSQDTKTDFYISISEDYWKKDERVRVTLILDERPTLGTGRHNAFQNRTWDAMVLFTAPWESPSFSGPQYTILFSSNVMDLLLDV